MGGVVNFYATEPSFSFHAGTGNYILTARFHRSSRYGVDHIYENCWLAGYRFNAKKYFNATLSAGAGDLALYHEDRRRSQNSRLKETVGLACDVEVQFNLYEDGQPTRWLFYANYYTNFNEYITLNGFSFGLGYSPGKKPWKTYKEWKADKDLNEDENVRQGLLKEDYKQAREAKRLKKSIRDSLLHEHNNKLHWEFSVFAGISDRPFAGGFTTFLEYKRVLLGTNFIASRRKHYTEWVAVAWHREYQYYKDRQYENMVFAGYRIWETSWLALNVTGGISWKTNKLYRSDNINDFRPYYRPIGGKTQTGLAMQSELSYTFHNRRVGIALIQFASFYKGYSSAGAAFSLRFGFLR